MGIRKDAGITREQYDEVTDKFSIAQDQSYPEDYESKLLIQAEIRDLIQDAGLYITDRVSNNRERYHAMLKLEEALMWAGKAIFKKDLGA